MSQTFNEATEKLRDFLYKEVYFGMVVYSDFIKASKILKELYYYFLEHGKEFLKESGMANTNEPLERGVCDFITSVTDRYAFNFYEKIFLPLP